MTIQLRAVSADDWRVWRTIRLAALTDAPGAFGSHRQEWVDASADRWRDRLSIPGAVNLLAVDVDHHTPVGMATAIPEKNSIDRAELISMWVEPAVRGRGVASALITAIADWAKGIGMSTLTLSVMPDNVAARRTYEKNGFTVAVGPRDPLPSGRRELVMVRDLDPERIITG